MSKSNAFKERTIQLLLFFAFMLPACTWAQSIQLTGTVTDTSGETVIGASVLEKGTTNGLITDIDGKFSLTVSPNATIIISYVGYTTQEIPLNGRKTLKVVLAEDNEMLDEVVVIGYGTMKKSDMTGAITSVDTDELTKRATTNPAEALQGKIAGVNIMKSGGNAGAGVSVKIRGVKSFGSNEPLYIIDGFPGDIDNVNPQDIQSMEVLKDGAAAAIYGSVAANGVIIITTKNGKKGETHIDFNTYLSMTTVANKLEMVNAEQYKSTIKAMFDNYNAENEQNPMLVPEYCTTDTGVDTDWQDAMMRTGLSQNYMFSVRGGSDVAQYSVSYNHSDDKGIFLGNDYRQDNARMKMHMSKYIFDIDANLSLRYTKSRQTQYSLREMYGCSPLLPIYDENEKYGFGLTATQKLPAANNVMADHHFKDAATKKFYTNANVSVGVKITDYLNFKTSYAYRGTHYRYNSHRPDYISNAQNPNLYPYSYEGTYYWEEQVIDNVLNFNKEFGKHNVSAMLGSSITTTKYTDNGVGVEGKSTKYYVDENGNLASRDEPAGFLDPTFSTIDAGIGGTFTGDGSNYKYNRASFFGRVNYSFAGKYLFQATVRRDGSSKFGVNNRWGTFPSIALGWRISEETFYPKDFFINNLKFRASWGRLGNENALGYYDFQALISRSNRWEGGYIQGSGNSAWQGAASWAMENRSLKWETTDTKNIGFDLGMFNNRLTGSINYYVNQTEDLLITKRLSPSAGYENPILNVGKIRNNGIELELNWSDKVKDFEYNVGFNFSTTKNKVVELADQGQSLPSTGLLWDTDHIPAYAKEGKPISGFYLYRTGGIFQSDEEAAAYVNKDGKRLLPNAKAGDIRFLDVNNDGVIDENDKEYCGTGIPKVEANLNFSGAYKGFDLSFSFGGMFGHKLYNGNRYFYESMSAPSNMLATVTNAWTPENPHTNVPRAIYNDPNGNSRESERFLENGNFVRLRQAQIGYSLPQSLLKKAYIEKLRFYVSGDNLFTITKYNGVDPEFSTSSPLNTGIDRHIYPFTRSFTVGAQLTF
ncbi:TonB-dependent receptor [uncultured Bacteroides sp.]|uniref:SusC/RagA family TonB-linked outer membrane protein n=1 Tax=uncultured Bacteroides sp. TaxID=162156 RepID=UPI0025ED17F3|nr:TonB-dependent receptor [uncultured Bacteroides sp.]